jgi:hypothetical protein
MTGTELYWEHVAEQSLTHDPIPMKDQPGLLAQLAATQVSK